MTYRLYQSNIIVENLDLIKADLDIAHNNFKKLFPESDSTWAYSKYNLFALTAPSTIFYSIYKEMRDLVRSELGNDRPLWFEAWINYIKYEDLKILDWHDHSYDYHGYISIDPKNTKTMFENYEISNIPGQIYFAEGNRRHKVEAIEPYEGVRTTIGFDIHTIPNSPLISSYVERPFVNMSLMPLV
jgi:hypothetical protein